MSILNLFKTAIAKPQTTGSRLDADGELPWGWLSENAHLCEPYEKKIVAMAVALRPLKGIDRIKPLEELISFYYAYKEICYSKDECYIKYFADKWEHCHNSKCADFEYITPYVEELEKLKGQE